MKKYSETEYVRHADKYAPTKTLTVRSTLAPWVDEELKTCMAHRDEMKRAAIKSGDYLKE